MQCLFGQLAFISRVQIEELAARMGHAANFGDSLMEACLVAGEIVAHQLAIPLANKVAGMLARMARAEVVNDCPDRRKRRSAVGPDVSAVGLLLARCELLHTRSREVRTVGRRPLH